MDTVGGVEMTNLQSQQGAIRALGSAIVLQALTDVIAPKIRSTTGKYFETYRKADRKDALNFLTGQRVKDYKEWFGLRVDLNRVKKLAQYRKDYLQVKIKKAKHKMAEENKEVRNRTAYRIALDKV